MRISACLVIRNEEKVLSRCLESIKNVVDEVIVVHDGGCSDQSLKIAEGYNAKIFVRPYVGVAEPHRPFSYEKARGEWILQIDADEFLSGSAQNEIPRLTQDKNVDAYSFSWPYVAGGQYIKNGPFSKTLKQCLFRKDKMFMLGIAQEYPRTTGILKKKSDLVLEHKPQYDNFNARTFRNKWINWAKLQAEQIHELEKNSVYNISNPTENKLFRFYQFSRKHPIWVGITETIRYFGIYLTRGILWSGWKSMKIAFFELSYLWLVKINLEKLKYGKKL